MTVFFIICWLAETVVSWAIGGRKGRPVSGFVLGLLLGALGLVITAWERPADDRPQISQNAQILTSVVGAAVLFLAIGGLASAGRNTAAGGCWYVNQGGEVPGAVAIHLPLCDGANANLQWAVLVSPGNMILGREPVNAREVCQMGIGSGSTGWVGVWADSTNSVAMGAGQELCEADVNSNGRVRWTNFH